MCSGLFGGSRSTPPPHPRSPQPTPPPLNVTIYRKQSFTYVANVVILANTRTSTYVRPILLRTLAYVGFIRQRMLKNPITPCPQADSTGAPAGNRCLNATVYALGGRTFRSVEYPTASNDLKSNTLWHTYTSRHHFLLCLTIRDQLTNQKS